MRAIEEPSSAEWPRRHPLGRRPGWRETPEGWAFFADEVPASHSYLAIDRVRARRHHEGAWHYADVAKQQHNAYVDLLAAIENGEVRPDFEVAAAAIRRTELAALSLIEIGCGSGYYSQVCARLLGDWVAYTGVDFSEPMIALAKANYGGDRFYVADARSLPFPAACFDVAMNGVSLMHIVDYARAIQETRRVASRFCLFHTTILQRDRETIFLEKTAYGRRTVEVIINEREFLDLADREGLRLVERWDSIPYDLVDEIGTHTYSATFLFEVVGPSRTTVETIAFTRADDMQASDERTRGHRGQMLNLGCGAHHHADWINLDLTAHDPDVIEHNLLERLPFVDSTFGMVYNSHVLEHLPKQSAPAFLLECRRVLAPGGLIRIVVPDLEQICRLYLECLERALAGEGEGANRYDWMVIELLDQMARQRSGGEMLEYWRQDPMPAGDFVIERVGHEAASAIAQIQAGHVPLAPKAPPTFDELGRFRLGGEVHQWMYDRFSAARLLSNAGFRNPVVRRADESALEGFVSFGLDTMPDGSHRKPDSLFVEAWRAD